jgi:hypothetical protein
VTVIGCGCDVFVSLEASNELRGEQLRKEVHPYVKFHCRRSSSKCSACLELAYYNKGAVRPKWVKSEDAATGWYV